MDVVSKDCENFINKLRLAVENLKSNRELPEAVLCKIDRLWGKIDRNKLSNDSLLKISSVCLELRSPIREMIDFYRNTRENEVAWNLCSWIFFDLKALKGALSDMSQECVVISLNKAKIK